MIVHRERFKQGEVYYSAYQEPSDAVTAVAVGIHRLGDAKWWDFNDSSWKSSGWTTKHQPLVEDDDGLWTLAAGWATPSLDEVYLIQWKVTDGTGTFYAVGPQLIVGITYANKYFTVYQEPDTGVTAIAAGIHRITDGYWYDFDDDTFKASGWTTKHKSLGEDDDGLWLDTTAWDIPPYGESYKVQWKVTDPGGTFYASGPKVLIDTTGEPAERDPSLDWVFHADHTDVHGNEDVGVLGVTCSIHGTWINWLVEADPLTVTTSQHGNWPSTFFITDSVMTVTVGFKADADGYGDFLTELFKKNFVGWSDIGAMNFTIGKGHEAGRKVMEWKGWVWQVLKLGNRAVAYGENGVTALFPDPNDPGDFGSDEIYPIGLKGKHAVCGDKKGHFFIDKKGQMLGLAEGLTMLDYSEYLSPMAANLVMSYDPESGLIYICDGSLGYIYSTRTGSLGEGPVNITGIYSQGGTLYVVAPADITIDPFEICTGIYDEGTRNSKSIHSLEIATDLTATLSAAIDHRLDKSAAFETTKWQTVDARGMVPIPVYCQEYRIRIKSSVYEYFEVDRIVVNRTINAH